MKARKINYRGTASEILDSINFHGYEIKSLRHGNTKQVLYYAPSEAHEWEGCWTTDLETAKKGVIKFNANLKNLAAAAAAAE